MATQQPDGRKWLLLLLFCPVFLIGCWRAPFLACDDPDYILFNPILQHNVSWSALFKLRTGEIPDFYVPLLYAIFRAERCIFEPLLGNIAGPNAWPCGIRIGNVLAHSGVCVLLWRLLRKLNATPLLAAFIVSATAFHPIVCHSVCWCYEGKTVYCAMLGFAAVLVYIEAQTARQLGLSSAVYLLALLTYPRAMGLVLVISAWELLGRPVLPSDDSTGNSQEPNNSSLQSFSARLRFFPRALTAGLRSLGRPAPWVALTAVKVWIDLKTSNMGQVALPPIGGSIWTAAMTDIPVLQRYVYNLLCPINLAPDYGIAAIVSPLDPRLWTGIFCLLLFVGTTFVLVGRAAWRITAFGWLWFIGALFPTLNFWGKHNLMTDNYVYFSLPGFFLVVGLVLRAIARWLKKYNFFKMQCGRIASTVIVALAASFGILSATRSTIYADTYELYENAVKNEPKCALSRLILARLIRQQYEGQLAEGDITGAALSADHEMLELEAGISGLNFYHQRLITSSFIWLGRAYYEHGRYDDAIKEFKMARNSPQGIDSPRIATVMHYMGLILLKQKRFNEALELLLNASSSLPREGLLQIEHGKAMLELGHAFAEAGDTKRSSECHQAALESFRSVEESDRFFRDAQILLNAAGKER